MRRQEINDFASPAASARSPKREPTPRTLPKPVSGWLAKQVLQRIKRAAQRSYAFGEVRASFLARQSADAAPNIYFVPAKHPLAELVGAVHAFIFDLGPDSPRSSEFMPADFVVPAAEDSRSLAAPDVRGHKRLGIDLVPDDAPASLVTVDGCSFVQFQEPGLLTRLLFEQQLDRYPFKLPDECRSIAKHLRESRETCSFDRASTYYRASLDNNSLIPRHELLFVAPSVKLEEAAATILERQRTHPSNESVPDLLAAARQVVPAHVSSQLAALLPEQLLGIDLVPQGVSCAVLRTNEILFVQLEEPVTWQQALERQSQLSVTQGLLDQNRSQDRQIEMDF